MALRPTLATILYWHLKMCTTPTQRTRANAQVGPIQNRKINNLMIFLKVPCDLENRPRSQL